MHASRQSWFDKSEGASAPSFGTGTPPRLASVDSPGTGADGTPPVGQRSSRRRPSAGSRLNPAAREMGGEKTHSAVPAAAPSATPPSGKRAGGREQFRQSPQALMEGLLQSPRAPQPDSRKRGRREAVPPAAQPTKRNRASKEAAGPVDKPATRNRGSREAAIPAAKPTTKKRGSREEANPVAKPAKRKRGSKEAASAKVRCHALLRRT